uniref:Uncharacterized protein n=1 Tax=Curvibacter symbiont subsp. Hydra magnipapillata TaxID=667019 RepID=C9YA74_CURXX|nr:hypothetical protein Csp_A10250 [Curvibacter putative symbiont of Hydra magnipapillata]
MSSSQSLTVADALKSLQDAVQAENTLIASRVTWYVTSQAFLLTAYATSWNAHFGWPGFFHWALPIAAIVLSGIIFTSIYAATWAQDMYLREQTHLIRRARGELELSAAELLALDVYERTTVPQRTNALGHVVGARVHGLVRITPLLLPVGFSLIWLYALMLAPRLG